MTLAKFPGALAMNRFISLSCLALLALASQLPLRADGPTPQQTVDLVLCLDTSNSMDGLIDSAKRKLWDIVNDLARAKPTPKLRVALYSYGNDGYNPTNGWVRKEADLTTDLDKISEKLFGLRTNGGTEYVGRVCQAALRELDWSKNNKALKLIFVCGNEPANQDPEVKLDPLAESAVRQNVIINTIYCGPANHSEAAGWKHLADRAEGKFMSIDQEGGKIAIAAPQDARLAELSGKLNHTYLFFGRAREAVAANQTLQDSNAAALGGAISASRAVAKAGAAYNFAENDLVDRLKNDPKMDLSKIAEAELPDDMKKMTPD
jgi:hypothetical protein